MYLSSFQGTNFVDNNVTANKEYEYRVSAVNEAGPGEPSDPSEVLAAKPEKGKIDCYINQIRNRNECISLRKAFVNITRLYFRKAII